MIKEKIRTCAEIHPSKTPSTNVKRKRKTKFHGVLRLISPAHTRIMINAMETPNDVQNTAGLSATPFLMESTNENMHTIPKVIRS